MLKDTEDEKKRCLNLSELLASAIRSEGFNVPGDKYMKAPSN